MMSTPLSAVPYNPPTITAEAAAKAAAGAGKRKIPAGVINSLAKKSKKMASEFQDEMEKHVKKKLDAMSGSQNNRKVGLKVSQFIPGKGLEVQGAQVELDPSIYCSLGLKGEKLVDPLDETFRQIKGRKVSMDFAFKLINNGDSVSAHDKQSRTTVFNCFRHVNPDSFNNTVTGYFQEADTAAKIQSNADWNKTLGPDASYVRRGTAGWTTGTVGAGVNCGTWRGVDGATDSVQGSYINGHTSEGNTLVSPFRYPNNMEIMYSRVNRQLLENYGWMLNPFKFVSFQANSATDPGVSTPTLTPSNKPLEVWANPGTEVVDFNQTVSAESQSNRKHSFPCQVNLNDPDGYQWHSQFGPGKLNYQFQNDGTNPVCIDICVVGVKKDTTVSVRLLENICGYNYAVHKFANIGDTDLNGFQTSINGTLYQSYGKNEWHDNAKMPFMPDCCFNNPQSAVEAFNYSLGSDAEAKEVATYLTQGKKNPFKVIKRDQFIVSSGSSRAWSTTLPSIKYRPQLYEDVEYPLSTNMTNADRLQTTADEYTFILCIGGSGLPKPLEENVKRFYAASEIVDPTGTGHEVDQKAIIDRQPSTCNVSVVGTYTETIQPTYPDTRSDVNFINGRLTEPYFTSAPGRFDEADFKLKPQSLNTVDIAKLGQVVRVADDGVIGVGAVTTDKGA